MIPYTELEAEIKRRKSTRKYQNKLLSEDSLEKLEQFIDSIEPLFEDQQTYFKIVESSEIKGAFGIDAPYYLVVSAEKTKGYLLNVGFMVQQFDLFISSIELGGCWVGMAKPAKSLNLDLQGDFVIAYAFGEPAGPPHRPFEFFKREEMDDICEGHHHLELIRLARLAPSATNSQPWYFVLEDRRIDLYRRKNNLIKGFFMNEMNQIDIGIALCHLYLAAKVNGFETEPRVLPLEKIQSIQGYYYEISIYLTEEK